MSKRSLAIGICFLLICSIFIPISLGYNVKVSKIEQPSTIGNGNTLYVGGVGPNNYSTIQSAIDDASEGDTVYVFDDSSPYYENVIVDKSISLFGENRETTIIDGNRNGNVVNITANLINVSGFTIRHSGGYIWNHTAGIDISSNYNNIYENTIISNHHHGISLWDSNSNTITGNTISSNELYGILFRDSKNNTIAGNTINSNGKKGILLGNSNINTITENIIDNNSYGIYLHESNSNAITSNTISSHNNWSGIKIQESKFNTITLNNISNNERGMELELANSNTIKGNNILDNKDFGMILFDSNKSTITSNTISNSDYGIYLFFSNFNNIIKNNFIDNKQNAYIENSFLSRWNQNYWNKARFLPKIIIGKVTWQNITIPWINIDWRPAKEPYDI